MRETTNLNPLIFYNCQGPINPILSLSILEQLAQRKKCAFQKHFRDNTSRTEHIHSLRHSSISLSLQLIHLWLFSADFRMRRMCVKPLRGNVARSTARHVEEERKVGWVVKWEISRFIGRKVGQIHPAPWCYKNIFGFDVAMGDFTVSGITQGSEDLKGDPFLLYCA